jgi:hypothetical protein
MKRLPVVAFIIFVFFTFSGLVYATSDQARQDYLFQFDTYRAKYTDFQVAKNEYAKFNTLTAQTTALEKTKTMLTQRDQLLRSYLFLLNEKLNEDAGLNATTKQLYRTVISSEVTFLEGHARLIPAIGSLEDAVHVSQELESHYRVLQVSIRQILIGLSLGQLSILSGIYDTTLHDAQALVATYGSVFSNQKQETVNRWLLQITNKRTLYQQKLQEITSAGYQLKTTDAQELDRQYREITNKIGEARQYLLEGASFLTELKNSIQYID